MLEIAICEDAEGDIQIYEDYFDRLTLKPISYDIFSCGEELLSYQIINQKKYSIYVLDIEMEGIDGITLAIELRKTNAKALIIFITRYDQYVYDVFEVTTFYFLRKPFSFEGFKYVIEKAANYLEATKQKFVFRNNRNYISLFMDEIIYIEKENRKAVIHSIEGKHECYMSIKQIRDQLSDVFAQIHGSQIVNLRYVKSIKNNEVSLTNGTKLYCSRAYNSSAKKSHLDFLRKLL